MHLTLPLPWLMNSSSCNSSSWLGRVVEEPVSYKVPFIGIALELQAAFSVMNEARSYKQHHARLSHT